jgi:hypothetical protein
MRSRDLQRLVLYHTALPSHDIRLERMLFLALAHPQPLAWFLSSLYEYISYELQYSGILNYQQQHLVPSLTNRWISELVETHRQAITIRLASDWMDGRRMLRAHELLDEIWDEVV